MHRSVDLEPAPGTPGTPEHPRTLADIAGIGPELAERITRQLHLTSLTELELAAHTGRLETVRGIGPLRARRIADALEAHFDRAHPLRPALQPAPSVAELLAIDREYRRAARRGMLPRVAPRRFNPSGAAWLPVLRLERGGTEYTAFFSNTANAHRAHKTHEWVIVLAARNGQQSVFTVVSETRGDWRGERVVRGREADCRAYYARLAA
jgi:hypothetical protein